MVLKRALRKVLHSKQLLMTSWMASPRLKGRWRCTKRIGFQVATDGCAALQITIVSTPTTQQYSWLVAQKYESHNSIANSFRTHACAALPADHMGFAFLHKCNPYLQTRLSCTVLMQ